MIMIIIMIMIIMIIIQFKGMNITEYVISDQLMQYGHGH